MAEAILNALYVGKVQNMADVHVYDTYVKRTLFLQKKYGITVSKSADESIKNAEVIVLAVKPQNVEQLAASIITPPTGMILSIVAGYTIAKISEKFATKLVIRTMPNTPAMISEGITVWHATAETPKLLKDKTAVLLHSIGEEVEVQDEKYLDMATAISGSGPAYVFLTMESMIDAGVHMGFSREIATKLVIATLRGSASYAMQSDLTVPSLKNNVTSPAGTTASALYELERGGFRTVVADAIWAAYRKALELGGQDSNVGPGRSKRG